MSITAEPGRRIVGQPVERVEDAALLTGRGRFMEDLEVPAGTLEAAIVRSPHPHARITGFDASRALESPGVRTVIGPDEVGELRPFSLSVKTPMPYRPGATDRVRYVGEPVAVVVAATRHLAEDAAERVSVRYEQLPAIVDTRKAMEPEAPKLHDEADGNVATDRTFSFGDVDGAFANAERVVEGEFSFPRYSSTPIETYGIIARWEGEAVTAWANFHGPFVMQPVIAGALGLTPGQVRLIVPEDIGGSFGIKSATYPYIVLMALASRHAQSAGPLDRGPRGAPPRLERRRRPRDALRGGGRCRWPDHRPQGRPDRQRRRLPAPARAVHALPLLRQYHRRLRHRRGRAPLPRRGNEQGADRPQPRVRRPAALLRARAARRQGREGRRQGSGGPAPAELRH